MRIDKPKAIEELLMDCRRLILIDPNASNSDRELRQLIEAAIRLIRKEHRSQVIDE